MRHTLPLFVVILLALQVGCGSGPAGSAASGPTSPTVRVPAPPTPAPEFPDEFPVVGNVWDNVHRPVAEALVEVIEGTRSGVSVRTDASGRYVFPGVFSKRITVRASKEGYSSQTQTFPFVSSLPGIGDLSFELDSPSTNLTGEYTMTIAADPACQELPAAVRRRTYRASFLPSPIVPNAYLVRFSGARFFPDGSLMSVRIAGDRARFDLNPYDPATIAEQLTPTTALGIWGTAQATVNGSNLSTPFNGTIEYCGDAVQQGPFPFYRCNVPPIDCTSPNHTLSLTID